MTPMARSLVVRKWLAKSLGNFAVTQNDAVACRESVEKLVVLLDGHGREVVVREELARALHYASLREPEVKELGAE